LGVGASVHINVKEKMAGWGVNDYINPDWSDKNRVHNWKNYISDEMKAMWNSFTDAQKIAIGKNAEGTAGEENWS
jgi:hypothetical protein